MLYTYSHSGLECTQPQWLRKVLKNSLNIFFFKPRRLRNFLKMSAPCSCPSRSSLHLLACEDYHPLVHVYMWKSMQSKGYRRLAFFKTVSSFSRKYALNRIQTCYRGGPLSLLSHQGDVVFIVKPSLHNSIIILC